MITVSTLLSKRTFSTFRLVSGNRGINNMVLATGFFEWEEERQIQIAFIRGSFVLTTLSMFRDNMKEAERYLKLMINNRVAAIAIKDVFFNGISEELKRYSDDHDVPIFIFSDTYINDIMRIIQNEVVDDINYSLNGSVLEMMIKNTELSGSEKQILLNKVNPYLHTDGIAALYISKSEAENLSASKLTQLYQEQIDGLKELMRDIKRDEVMTHSIVLYKRGFFLVLGHKDDDEIELEHYIHTLVKKAISSKRFCDLHVGISAISHGTEIEKVLKDAIYANTNSILDDKRSIQISEIGIDAVIFSHIESEATQTYMNHITEAIAEAESNNTPFMETILAYVACNGNIESTASILHQHRNTVRYRIDKICRLFGNDDEITFMGKLFFFARVYQAKPYLDKLI